MVWTTIHQPSLASLAESWYTKKTPPEHQKSLTSTHGIQQLKILLTKFQVFPFRCKEQIATVPFDQDLFVPLRLEGSPRERQLIEVGFEWDDCVSPLRGSLHPSTQHVGTVWNHAAFWWNMLINGEQKSRVIINHRVQLWNCTEWGFYFAIVFNFLTCTYNSRNG